MPFFKTTKNILTTPWEDELHDDNWFDKPFLTLPPTKEWDYSREPSIEDIDIWEVIYEASGGIGLYAAWLPYCEYYMLTTGWQSGTMNDRIIETYYGKRAQKEVYKRCIDLGIPIQIKKKWVEEKDMWLYA